MIVALLFLPFLAANASATLGVAPQRPLTLNSTILQPPRLAASPEIPAELSPLPATMTSLPVSALNQPFSAVSLESTKPAIIRQLVDLNTRSQPSAAPGSVDQFWNGSDAEKHSDFVLVGPRRPHLTLIQGGKSTAARVQSSLIKMAPPDNGGPGKNDIRLGGILANVALALPVLGLQGLGLTYHHYSHNDWPLLVVIVGGAALSVALYAPAVWKETTGKRLRDRVAITMGKNFFTAVFGSMYVAMLSGEMGRIKIRTTRRPVAEPATPAAIEPR